MPDLSTDTPTACLALADGTIFYGMGFGATGTTVAELLGVESAHVLVRIQVDHLPNLDIPGWNAATGSTGTVRYRLGETGVVRPIRILHLAGSLGQSGRMARLLCELEDPFGLERTPDRLAAATGPMLFGAFVDVELELPNGEEALGDALGRLGDATFADPEDARLAAYSAVSKGAIGRPNYSDRDSPSIGGTGPDPVSF